MKRLTATAIAALTTVATLVPAQSTLAGGPRTAPLTYGVCVAELMPAGAGSQGTQAPGQGGNGPFVALIDLETGDAVKIIGPFKSPQFTVLRACGRK